MEWNKEAKKSWDILGDLAFKSSRDLEKLYNEENCKALNVMYKVYLGEDFNLETLTKEDFIINVYGVDGLGRAIERDNRNVFMKSHKLYDEGKNEEAIEVVQEFIDKCPCEFRKDRESFTIELYKDDKFRKTTEDKDGWGRKSADIICQVYDLYEKGKKDEALKAVEDFLEVCPKNMYRSSIEILKESVEKDEIKVIKKWSDREY